MKGIVDVGVANRLRILIARAIAHLAGHVRRRQFVRYLLVGVGNTAFSYGAYVVLLFLGLPYRQASLFALVLGVAFSFTMQGNLVFHNATRVTLVKFVIAWTVIYGLNILIIDLLMRVSFNAYLAGAFAIVPVTLASYFILKLAVFNRGAPDGRAKQSR